MPNSYNISVMMSVVVLNRTLHPCSRDLCVMLADQKALRQEHALPRRHFPHLSVIFHAREQAYA
jgi:hypothetical protein